MLFNSMQFVLFFAAVVLLYFSLPFRFRWILLLAASYYFYMCWNVKYLILIILSTLVDYVASRCMESLSKPKRKKYLFASLLTNLGLLFAFKYFNFFSSSLNQLFDSLQMPVQIPFFNVLLPVGISFYTFQTLSYTIDVYRGKIPVERNLGIFALYVAFFPQLVAGPIERAANLLPQFRQNNLFDDQRVVSGLRLILWGFFKKLVVADRLALYVDAVYSNTDIHSGLTLLIATYFFAFQIYCDFSGYSDIAIGSARVLGYRLMTNFDRPYFSLNIQEFWHRWHISLSTWFKDYLYIPLGGSRVAVPRMYFNLMTVFVVSGLWHGANWTFVFWGGLHGVYHILSRLTLGFRDRAAQKMHFPGAWIRFSRILITFHLVCFSWIYFRADSLQSANHIVGKIFTLHGKGLYISALDQFVYGLLAIAILCVLDGLQEHYRLTSRPLQFPTLVRWCGYLLLSVIIVLMGVFNGSQFIYFQF